MDMARQRDEYYAAQTLGKKLADIGQDITETVSATAQAVKQKLSKREQPVVRPMRAGGKRDSKRRFLIVAEEEEEDALDMDSSTTDSTA